MQYSPKLKMAMQEIKEVLNKHDIAGMIILADGTGFSEFVNKVEASWSGAFIQHTPQGTMVRLRIKQAEVGKEKAKEMAERTFNMITHFAEMLGKHSLTYFELLDRLKQQWDTEDTDRGRITGEQEQNN